jgi:hypothetical protein
MKVCHKIKRSSRPSLWVEIVIYNSLLVEKTTKHVPTRVLLSLDLPPCSSPFLEIWGVRVYAKTYASEMISMDSLCRDTLYCTIKLYIVYVSKNKFIKTICYHFARFSNCGNLLKPLLPLNDREVRCRTPRETW